MRRFPALTKFTWVFCPTRNPSDRIGTLFQNGTVVCYSRLVDALESADSVPFQSSKVAPADCSFRSNTWSSRAINESFFGITTYWVTRTGEKSLMTSQLSVRL